MKKGLVFVVAIVVILTFVLAGCNLIVTNEERDGDQVVATVEHNGLIGEITKKEFSNYFLQNYQTYSSYFQWSVEEAGEYFISLLARQKMLTILATEKLTDGKVDKDKFNAIASKNIQKGDTTKGYGVYSAYLMSLLQPDEQKYVKEQTNKMFIDAYEEKIQTEIENDKIREESENKDNDKNKGKEPRPVKSKDESTEFKPDSSVRPEDVAEIKSFFDDEKYKPNENSSQYEKDAFKERERALSENYITYEYYLAKQIETRITTKYEELDEFKDTSDIKIKVENLYATTLAEQEKSYKTASNYKSAIEGSSPVIYHNGRYVKIKSILLQFSDKQKSDLSYINSAFSKEIALKLREALVFGNIDALDIPATIDKDNLGLKVYKSNLKYDPNKTAGDPSKVDKSKIDPNKSLQEIAEEFNYPYLPDLSFDPEKDESDTNQKWQTFDFAQVIAEIGAEIKEIENTAATGYDNEYPNQNTSDPAYQIGKKMYIAQKKAEAFENWIYTVNDDSGMFEGKEYTESPVGNSSDYVTEFAGLVRQLLLDNGTAGSISITNTGTSLGGNFTNINKTQIDVPKFENNIAKKDQVTIYTDTTNDISFVINEFGVHIVMLTTVPVDMAYNVEGDQYEVRDNADFDLSLFEKGEGYSSDEIEIIKNANKYYVLKLNAFVSFDEETGKAVTLQETLEKQVRDTYNSTVYSNHTKKLFEMYGEDLFDKKDDKQASEGYADYKFNKAELKKSVYNSVLSYVKKYFNVK